MSHHTLSIPHQKLTTVYYPQESPFILLCPPYYPSTSKRLSSISFSSSTTPSSSTFNLSSYLTVPYRLHDYVSASFPPSEFRHHSPYMHISSSIRYNLRSFLQLHRSGKRNKTHSVLKSYVRPVARVLQTGFWSRPFSCFVGHSFLGKNGNTHSACLASAG